jgi:site-specific recombinase XerD
MAGVDIRTLQELLGHKTIAMNVRSYSHLAPKHTLAVVERLDTPSASPTDTKAFEQPAIAVPLLQ